MNCSTCGKLLLRHDWNSVVDVLVCDNSACPRFRQPIPIDKDAVLEGDLTSLVEAAESSGKKRRKTKLTRPEESEDDEEVSSNAEVLHRLREELSAKKENPEIL